MKSIVNCKFVCGYELSQLKNEAAANDQFVMPIWESYYCGDRKFNQYARTNGKETYFACIDGDTLCGVMRITPNPRNRENGKFGYYVRPSMRKKGYAKEMIRFAKQYASENGIDVTAVVDSANAYSMKALTKAGWSKTGTVYEWKGSRKGVEFAPE